MSVSQRPLLLMDDLHILRRSMISPYKSPLMTLKRSLDGSLWISLNQDGAVTGMQSWVLLSGHPAQTMNGTIPLRTLSRVRTSCY